MKSFIRNLSGPGEFCLILLICFGLSIFTGIRGFVSHLTNVAKPVLLTDFKLLLLVGYQLVAVAIVVWIARVRGWSIATFGWRISWKWTGAGILLLIVTLVAVTFQTVLFNYLNPPNGKVDPLANGGLTLPFIILLSIINPVFEELMEVGYFVHALKRYGVWPAVLASAFFRALLHGYGGFNLAATVLLIGLIFGSAYAWWRQLWPLILAHAIMDFFALYRLLHIAHTTAHSRGINTLQFLVNDLTF
jgi:membrane protease YdiL (CAAX protease family)